MRQEEGETEGREIYKARDGTGLEEAGYEETKNRKKATSGVR